MFRPLKFANLLAVHKLEADIDALVILGIAYTLPLPPAHEVKFAYYRDNLKAQVDELVCDINEVRVLNCQKVIDTVRTSYMYRLDAMNFPHTNIDELTTTLSESALAILPDVIEMFQV